MQIVKKVWCPVHWAVLPGTRTEPHAKLVGAHDVRQPGRDELSFIKVRNVLRDALTLAGQGDWYSLSTSSVVVWWDRPQPVSSDGRVNCARARYVWLKVRAGVVEYLEHSFVNADYLVS